jgi:hypothetical protein
LSRPSNEQITETALRRSHAYALLVTASLLTSFLASNVAFAQEPARGLPPNAHARPYGAGWQCDFGYREMNRGCVAILTPANGHLVESSFGRGWECNRGYRASDEECVKVEG